MIGHQQFPDQRSSSGLTIALRKPESQDPLKPDPPRFSFQDTQSTKTFYINYIY